MNEKKTVMKKKKLTDSGDTVRRSRAVEVYGIEINELSHIDSVVVHDFTIFLTDIPG